MGVRWQPFDWYETPLYYDIVFDVDTPEEADFLERVAREHGRGGKRVLEPACGSGRLLAEMARRGWSAAGFDASPGMLEFAEKRFTRRAGGRYRWARDIRAEQGLLQDFSLGRGYDLAHCLVSTFKYLATEADARAHLEGVAGALAPGGIYVLGLHLSDYDDPRASRERWVVERDGVHVVCTIHGWAPEVRRRRERVRSRLVVSRADEEVKRYESEWWFRTYDAPQLRRLLRSVPRLEHVATYGFDYALDAPVAFDGERLDLVLVLRRR